MKKCLFFIILSMSLLFGVHAQRSLPDYKGLKSEGTMPQALQEIFSMDAKTPEDTYLKLICENGKIVYGSSLNRYLDAIMDNLLVNDPQLRNSISVFVVKSPAVNAYAMNKGFIFVNVGLLAQLTNEAEMAFILAHELVHFAQKHSIKPPKIFNMDTYLRYHNRSREQENEADRYALEWYYAASKYSYKAMESAFDVLQYGYLPFDEIPFKRSMVETDFYSFDNNYYLENVKAIRSREDYIDTLSTHPNILKRRNAAQSIVSSTNDQGRSAFVQSEELFKEIRTLARLECIHQYLTRHDYGNAYYNAYVLNELMPGNTYLQNAMAIAVYGLNKHRQEGGLREVLPKINTVEGEKQQVYHFFEKLTKQEFNVLAVRLLWNAYKQSPNNKTLLLMTEDAVKDMLFKNKLDLNNFSDYAQKDTVFQDNVIELDSSSSQGTKYDRIKTTSAAKVKPTQLFKTVHFMLVDLKKDNDFVALVERVKNKTEDAEILDILQTENQFTIKDNKLLVIDPICRVATSKEAKSMKKSLEKKQRLTNTIEKTTEKLDIRTAYLSKSQLANSTTEQYNQYCGLKDWLEDVYSFRGNMVFYHNGQIEQIAEDLNCQYTMVTATTVLRGQFVNYAKFQDVALSLIFCPISSPAYIARFFLPGRTSESECGIIEMETGKMVYLKRQTVRNANSHEAFIHAFLYDCLYDIKKGRRK